MKGHYIKSSKLKYYDGINSYTYNNPIPGFYMNKCNNKKYIQCSSKFCTSKILPEDDEECNSSTDGKLIKTGNIFSVCTKINKLNTQANEVDSTKYISIPFTTSNVNDRYLIHHAGDIFNFNRSTLTTYYVVSKNTTSIIFDPTYENVIDYCANTSGLIIDRISDFCSSDSSGMYYTCTTGICTSEYQTKKGYFENNGENCMYF